MSHQIEFIGQAERVHLRERCLGLTGEYTNLIGRDTL